MAEHTFGVEVRFQRGATILDMHGHIDGRASEALGIAYQEAVGAGASAVVLNFTRVEYINSSGIAAVVRLLAQARAAGRRLIVYGLSDHYQDIFRITRLSDFMNIQTDEASAIASATGVS